MAKRVGIALLLASTAAIAAAYASAFLPGGAPPWAAWVLAVGTAAVMVSMMLVGAARQGRVGRLGWVFLLVFVWVAGGFLVLLALPPVNPGDPALWLGLPPRAAVLMYGIGLAPLFVVPVAYARTFDHLTLSDEDLARVRSAARDAAAAGIARDAAGAAAAPADPAKGDAR